MTISAPLFSIVTITKDNLEGFLATRDSIERQSSKNYEWIVIDGASADGTRGHLPQGAISEPDRGIYDAMNKGIERARGEYILFLNAGDVLADMDILATLEKAAADRPDFIYGDALETGGFYKKARGYQHSLWGMFTHHQAMIYRRDLVGDLRYGTDYRIAGDYDFTVKFLKKARKMHYIPAAVCVFETGGVSQKNMRLGRREQFDARKQAGIPLWKNWAVYFVQSAAACLKKLAPGLYRFSRATFL